VGGPASRRREVIELIQVVGHAGVRREALPQIPQALDESAKPAFQGAVERCPSARDLAIAAVFSYTGLRQSELTAFDVADVSVSARRGRLRVGSGKGDACGRASTARAGRPWASGR
jgi:site-specific recombinase XerC